MTKKAQEDLESSANNAQDDAGQPPPPPSAPAGRPERQRMNLFEDGVIQTGPDAAS